MILPGNLNAAVAHLVEAQKDLRVSTQVLAKAYRAGKDSGHVNLGAYLATRVPATFAANMRVLAELKSLRPEFSPRSLLDVGAGPGTASWASLHHWPELGTVGQVEKLPSFRGLAGELNLKSELSALLGAQVFAGDVLKLATGLKSDLVIASYVLAELPLHEIESAVANLWRYSSDVLVLIEPGTPGGFGRLRLARDKLLAANAHVLAPCTHSAVCPMTGADWCHFKVRVQRSRAHMLAKNAVVPFEDEAFSYLVLQRQVSNIGGARVLSPPDVNKIAVSLRLCTEQGVSTQQIASRNKALYKQAKKISWGGLWKADDER